MDQLTTDQWELQPLIFVPVAILSVEVQIPGPVRVMDSGVGHLQLVKVSVYKQYTHIYCCMCSHLVSSTVWYIFRDCLL